MDSVWDEGDGEEEEVREEKNQFCSGKKWPENGGNGMGKRILKEVKE